MKRYLTYDIKPADAGQTIAHYLKAQGYTGKLLTALRHDPNYILTRNHEKASTNELLQFGDILEVTLQELKSSEHIIPEQLPIDILYEDEDILVVNKPAGMPIHPSVNHHTGTLANAVAGYYEKQGISYVFRCMNRLDRDTSGVTVLAKHALSGAILSQTVKEDGFQKEYRAIVTGVTEEEGTIDLPIGRKEGSIIERTIDMEHGQPAVTHYKRLGVYTSHAYENLAHENHTHENHLNNNRHKITQYSYLKIKIDTGRTHQIRVHMSAIGHPLPGDFLYNKETNNDKETNNNETNDNETNNNETNHETSSGDFKRQPLHCARMAFEHPITKQWMDITAELPEDMKSIVSRQKESTATKQER